MQLKDPGKPGCNEVLPYAWYFKGELKAGIVAFFTHLTGFELKGL
jgi:hypothetical protein